MWFGAIIYTLGFRASEGNITYCTPSPPGSQGPQPMDSPPILALSCVSSHPPGTTGAVEIQLCTAMLLRPEH